MRKTIYYLSPFLIFPVVFFTITLLDSVLNRVEFFSIIEPHILYATLFFLPALIGATSPAKTTFDYGITLIVPISVFLSLFLSLLFDESDLPALHHALNTAYYPIWLPIALIMMVITFIASFLPIRNKLRRKS